MEFVDKKFARNKARYVLQCLLAGASVLLLLIILDPLSNAAVLAALGASCFIAFTMPHAQVSRARFLVGGYVVGVGAGVLCSWLSDQPWTAALGPPRTGAILFGALAVGLAIFVMVVTNSEHPPAASLALGLVLGESRPITLAVVLIGIVAMSAIKRLLKPALINLL